MRTHTVTSVTVPGQGTFAISSNVVESAESALEHLREMSRGRTSEPFYVTSGHYWRWTWEYVNALGYRCTDTVRLVP